ncbi:unnamed protein product [Euphydryas editha]|uniref:Uncharacterized protein n=1 Tax=Euphydryas editha TaxID=104508 RepID=A0AAU9TLX6_EUPED|nr:unnamed protein product [Euphydryas editha]
MDFSSATLDEAPEAFDLGLTMGKLASPPSSPGCFATIAAHLHFRLGTRFGVGLRFRRNIDVGHILLSFI